MASWTVPGHTEVRALGAGGTGRVVEAVHDQSGARVAIKYLSARLCSDESFRSRLRTEAAALADVEHPNVVRVRELVETESDAALVMEQLKDASSLRQVLAVAAPLSPQAALAVLRQSLLGLGTAHNLGIAHRDLKPANVLLTAEGVSKLVDFGIAERSESMMPAAGTPAYMAPELWEGAVADPVTDIYAATATFYECLTGRVPYTGGSVFELQTMHRAAPIPASDVPPALRPLLERGLAKTPHERPANVTAFLAELEAVAMAEFGPGWEQRGQQELGALVAPPREGSAASPGRGAKTGIAVSAIAVIGVAMATMTFGSGKGIFSATSKPSGEITSATSDAGPAQDGPTGSIVPVAKSTARGGPTTPHAPGIATLSTAPTSSIAPVVTGTQIAMPLPSPSTVATTAAPWSTSQAASSSAPTTPAAPTTATPTSSTPSQTPSSTVTISAAAQAVNGTYTGPCPPTSGPTIKVTFTVAGLLSSGTVAITYHWHLTGGATGDGAEQSASVANGDTSFQLTVNPQQPKPPAANTVTVEWTAADGLSGTTNQVPITINCQ